MLPFVGNGPPVLDARVAHSSSGVSGIDRLNRTGRERAEFRDFSAVFNSIGVSFADQKRIFAILESYAGEHIEIGDVFEKIDSNWLFAICSRLTSRGGNTDKQSVRELMQDSDVRFKAK